MDGDAATALSGRKRARASSPKPGGAGAGAVGSSSAATAATAAGQRQQRYEEQALLAARIRDPSRRTAALNDLLRLTCAHDHNFSLVGDAVLRALVGVVLDDCLGWEEEEVEEANEDDDEKETPYFRSQRAWEGFPTGRGAVWARHCQSQLGPVQLRRLDAAKIRTVEVVLVIFRNLSFVGANLRLLAYSPRVLDVLVGCLYEETGCYDDALTSEDTVSSSATNQSALALSATQTLIHLAPYLDVSGQRLLADRLFYRPPLPVVDGDDSNINNTAAAVDVTDGPGVPDAHKFGQCVSGSWGFGGLWLAKRLDTKEDVVADISKDLLLELTSDYLVAVYGIFPALCHVLTNPRSPRSVVLMAIDFLQEIINQARIGVIGGVDLDEALEVEKLPSLRAILVQMPDAMLERLVDLLYVPRLGPDSIEYIDPVHNIVTRITTLKLLMGYDATVDTDVRDRALDVLVPLLELDSPRMASRFAHRSLVRLFEAVVPILTTNVGRNEASMLAYQLLRELSLAEENATGFLYIQERLVELASRDPRVSQLVWNHLYTTTATSTAGSGDEGSDDEEEEEEEEGEEEEEEEEGEEGEEEGESDEESGDE